MSDATPEVGPWAREKLQALGDYLSFYTTALKNQRWVKSLTYVDAFAGAGQARVRRVTPSGMDDLLATVQAEPLDADAEQYIRRSPRVALDIPNRFSSYVFIERNPGRAAELELLRKEYGESCSIDVRQGTAQQEVDALLRTDLGKSGHLGVVFLDPFGMQVPWETIQSLAATGRVEIIVNFALGMAIQRVLARSAELGPGWHEALDRLFGAPDWHDQVYEHHVDLLGTSTRKREDAGMRLLEWYRRRLREAFGHVSPAKLIRNTRGGHLYYLIWAGPNALGLKGAHHVLSKGESVR